MYLSIYKGGKGEGPWQGQFCGGADAFHRSASHCLDKTYHCQLSRPMVSMQYTRWPCADQLAIHVLTNDHRAHVQMHLQIPAHQQPPQMQAGRVSTEICNCPQAFQWSPLQPPVGELSTERLKYKSEWDKLSNIPIFLDVQYLLSLHLNHIYGWNLSGCTEHGNGVIFFVFLVTVFGNLEVWKVKKWNSFLKYISAGV